MTRTLLWAILLTSTRVFGQSPTSRLNPPVTSPAQIPDTTTTLRVVYPDKLNRKPPTAWFLNGQRVGYSLADMIMLRPNSIQDIKMVNGVVQIDGITYNGQQYVTTKSTYTPQLISLTELKKKYTKLGNEPTLFFIDNGYVNDRYDTYLIDEKALSSIVLNTVKNAYEAIDMHVIKLVMKWDEAARKPPRMLIRGGEVGLSKERTDQPFAAGR